MLSVRVRAVRAVSVDLRVTSCLWVLAILSMYCVLAANKDRVVLSQEYGTHIRNIYAK